MANERLLLTERECLPDGSDSANIELESGTFANSALSRRGRDLETGLSPSVGPAPRSKRLRAVAIAGAVLAALFLIQATLGAAPARLAQWQQNESYKVATGVGLAAFIGFQWILSLSRVKRWSRLARSTYAYHQVIGAFAPALLFLHSQNLGYGCTLALSAVFLGNSSLGLLVLAGARGPKLLLSRGIIVHVALSILVVALGAYHAWTALYYE